MKTEKLIIQHVVGYMLKVLRSGATITSYKKEFAHIRHGNYYQFVKLVNTPTDEPIVVYNAGTVTLQTEIKETDFDFLGLIFSGNSLRVFYKNCRGVYGDIMDTEIKDLTYEKAVLFEIGLRMHAKNNSLYDGQVKLEEVINLLCDFKVYDAETRNALHQGRQFINVLKHTDKLKAKFASWQEGIAVFNKSFDVLVREGLSVQ